MLLLEKAFAKWFGSYSQLQGAHCMARQLQAANHAPNAAGTLSIKTLANLTSQALTQRLRRQDAMAAPNMTFLQFDLTLFRMTLQ